MATSLHTFNDIFESEFDYDGDTIRLNKIVIPIIQRDYAQGRVSQEVNRVRNRFLNALYEAVNGTPITLDFVYGDINSDGTMIPLDGQQRLTTLFLLYWYAAKKQDVSEEEYSFLKGFSYDTRYSARDFCMNLIGYMPSFQEIISKEIIDQPWFPLDWKKDPTIASMLVVIDAINDKFFGVDDLWERLLDNKITFYFLPIKDMGLTDDLYIKMNSRGKPLTLFEHFKAELEHEIEGYSIDVAKRIVKKIDSEWTDLLWAYREYDNTVGNLFLRYFHFICDVICYRNNETTQGKSTDEFDLIKAYFDNEDESISERIEVLEKFFDCWVDLSNKLPISDFFDNIFSKVHSENKVKIDARYEIDVFRDCLETYGDITGGNKNRSFSLNKFILLYAVTIYVIHIDEVKYDDFIRRLRIINNLVRNSEGEVSDSVKRAGGNRMPAILEQVDSIILLGKINVEINNNFNMYQLEEEISKLEWTSNHPEKAKDLYQLEDHDLLFGQIGIVGLENHHLFNRFSSLFECSLDNISCALLALGDYKQKDRNGWRYQIGSHEKLISWMDLFHKSSASGYENTKNSLVKLLSITNDFTDEFLESLADDYISDCEDKNRFDWRYYYIKYDCFRIGGFGKINWADFDGEPYDFTVMKTESQVSSTSYNPFLKEIDRENRLSRDDNGQIILLDDRFIECHNDGYYAYSNQLDDEDKFQFISCIQVEQDENGIDIQNRINLYYENIETINPNVVKVVYDGTPGDFDLVKNKFYYVLGTTSDSYYIYDETEDVYLYPKSIFKSI